MILVFEKFDFDDSTSKPKIVMQFNVTDIVLYRRPNMFKVIIFYIS